MRPLRYWVGWAVLGLLIVTLGAPAMAAVTAAPAQPAVERAVTTASYANSDQLAALVDQLLPRQLAEAHIPGASVALVQGGRLLLAQGYGYADLERRTPVIADAWCLSYWKLLGYWL